MAAHKAIMSFIQDGYVLNSEYFERFNALVKIALSFGSSIGHSHYYYNKLKITILYHCVMQ